MKAIYKFLPIIGLAIGTFLVENVINNYFISNGLNVRSSHMITVLALICFLVGFGLGRWKRIK
ncbi:hypothetical protein CIG75_17850 [Tumebacillus algifaecis]|uniref:Uncharacterized protein n=1 Tax=Tumebacillus algifaecis TaxID=1214604 RepID=A0A223D4V3_9BACL|nr:hypothetical protein CIG75_17850 [Tumebacillus algifaecis]